jgi:hypothetical protein
MQAFWNQVLLAGLLGVAVAVASSQQSSMTGAAMAAGGHMDMTALRPAQPGDKERADAIVVAARKAAEQYLDYHRALADGYEIFMPEMPQPVYHFIRADLAFASRRYFDPAKPPALLYEKTAGGKPGYKLVGVMYMAPFRDSEAQLNARIPLSVAQWHMHTNICVPPPDNKTKWLEGDQKFGVDGSIATREACSAAGGMFIPHLSGWMTHVYPFEQDAAKVWQGGMDDDHLMQHSAMPGMKMGPGDKM